MLHIEPELVSLARQGDECASRTIIERLHRPILATIHRCLGSRFRDQVERALSALSEEHRLAFVLRHYERLRYAQIVGVPESTIKTRIHRARKALRGLLSRHVAVSA